MIERANLSWKEWQLACVKAIAKAWADPSFKQLLKKDPPKALASKPIHFTVPHGVEIVVVEAGDTVQAAPPTYNDGWSGTPLLLVLPDAPKVEDQAIALAQLIELSQSDARCCSSPCCC